MFATNQFLSMGFFQQYDPDVFNTSRIPAFTPPLSGLGGFFIDEGGGQIFSGCFELTFGSVIPSPSTCKDSPMGYTASQTVTAKVVGLGFVRGVMGR